MLRNLRCRLNIVEVVCGRDRKIVGTEIEREREKEMSVLRGGALKNSCGAE